MIGFCFSCVFLYTSCVDDTSEVGLELQNPNDRSYVYSDTTTELHSYSLQQKDSISCNPYILAGNFLLGYMNDPEIGDFQNNFMTEVRLSSLSVDFGENPVFDSLVLFLTYSKTYGDMSQMQQITLYELNHDDTLSTIDGKPMDEATISEYVNSTPVTNFSFQPTLNDTVSSRVRVVMPKEFMERFTKEDDYATDSIFRKNVLNGFYFVAEEIPEGGAISYISVGDSTHMMLYYHNDEDTLSFNYVMSSITYRTNIFFRKYNDNIKYVPLETPPSSEYEQENCFVTNNNGLETRIDISGLHTWADSGYFTINSAILTIPAKKAEILQDSLYPPISSVYPYLTDDEFIRYQLLEYSSTNGKYSTVSYKLLDNYLPDSIYGFEIDLRRTVYDAIMHDDDKISVILTPITYNNISYFERVILNGAKNSENPMKFVITYTKLNAN